MWAERVCIRRFFCFTSMAKCTSKRSPI
jgi:hypothetical protein